MAVTISVAAISPTEFILSPLTTVPFTVSAVATNGENVGGALIGASGVSVNGASPVAASGTLPAAAAPSGSLGLKWTGFPLTAAALGFWNAVPFGTSASGNMWNSGVNTPTSVDAFSLDPPGTQAFAPSVTSEIAFSAIYQSLVVRDPDLPTPGGALGSLAQVAAVGGEGVSTQDWFGRIDNIEIDLDDGKTQGQASFNFAAPIPRAIVIDKLGIVIPTVGGSPIFTPTTRDWLTITDVNGNVVELMPMTTPQMRTPIVVFASGTATAAGQRLGFEAPLTFNVSLGRAPLPSGAAYDPLNGNGVFQPPFSFPVGVEFNGLAVLGTRALSATPTPVSLGPTGTIGPSGLNANWQAFVRSMSTD